MPRKISLEKTLNWQKYAVGDHRIVTIPALCDKLINTLKSQSIELHEVANVYNLYKETYISFFNGDYYSIYDHITEQALRPKVQVLLNTSQIEVSIETCIRFKHYESLSAKICRFEKENRSLDWIRDLVGMKVLVDVSGSQHNAKQECKGIILCYQIGFEILIPAFIEQGFTVCDVESRPQDENEEIYYNRSVERQIKKYQKTTYYRKSKDYIKYPKPYGYSSLHVYLCKNGKYIELQIETANMLEDNKSHDTYKDDINCSLKSKFNNDVYILGYRPNNDTSGLTSSKPMYTRQYLFK